MLYGAMAMVTVRCGRERRGRLVGLGRTSHDVAALWMVFVSYLLLRRYGGPGAETLAAALAVFGMATSPFVYLSVNIWRTIHPLTSVVPTLPVDFAFALWYAFAGFLLLYIALMTLRVRIEEQRALVDQLYLESEE